jgi:Tfp pilus assembly protein PilN
VSRVNLLPPEIKERAKLRQRTALAVLGVIGLLVLVGAFYLLEQMNLSEAQDKLAAQEQTNAGLQTRIKSLSEFGDLQAELAAKQELEDAVYTNELAFSGVLMDVSRVIPPDAVLTAMTAQVGASGTGEAVEVVEGAPVGTITFEATANDLDSAALWLTRLEQVDGWVNPYSTTLSETAPRTRQYIYSSTVDLSEDALTERGRRANEAAAG